MSMTAREWLSRYRELIEEIDRETREAHYWEDKAIGLSPSKLSHVPKSRWYHDSTDYIAEFLDLAKKCSDTAKQAEQAKDEINDVIESIDSLLYRRVLKKKYIDNMTYREIATQLHYSTGYIRRVMSKAIKEVTQCNKYIEYNIKCQD